MFLVTILKRMFVVLKDEVCFAMTLLNFRRPQRVFLSELESLPGEDLRQRFACRGTVTSGRGKKSVKHILFA